MTSLEATKVFLPLSKGKEREIPKGRRNKAIRKKFLFSSSFLLFSSGIIPQIKNRVNH
jgi:hypothetical protein